MGYDQEITPSMGPDVAFPCIWQQIKSQDTTIRTASFTNWNWFWYVTSLGLPTALDYDYYCDDYTTCDEQLVLAATEYLENAIRSADSTYTFVYIGNIDGTGHRSGWCGRQYMSAVDEADRLVGLLMDVVDRAELDVDPDRIPAKITVMLGTDHGGHLFTHWSFQDSDLIIPSFIRGPRISSGSGGGQQFRHEVNNVDYAPTAMEWLGLKPNPWWHGRVLEQAMEQSKNREKNSS
jgi:Type I phosphodiesterase / nucleotide pyrophosphatase